MKFVFRISGVIKLWDPSWGLTLAVQVWLAEPILESNILKKGKWLRAIIARNKLLEKALIGTIS